MQSLSDLLIVAMTLPPVLLVAPDVVDVLTPLPKHLLPNLKGLPARGTVHLPLAYDPAR